MGFKNANLEIGAPGTANLPIGSLRPSHALRETNAVAGPHIAMLDVQIENENVLSSHTSSLTVCTSRG